MFYPLRLIRRKQLRQRGLLRLVAKHKLMYLRRINQKKYPKQPKSNDNKHVYFSGKKIVCRYEANEEPMKTMIRRPSHISNITKLALEEEAKQLGIKVPQNNEEKIRKLVCKKWIENMRQHLSSFSISTESIRDCDMEAYYNLFIGLKIAANLRMAGVDVIPRAMSLTELHRYMEEHRLKCSSPQSLLACIACVENYLIDKIPLINFDVNSDMSRKRFSAVDLFFFQNPITTYSMLVQELQNRGIHPAKTADECRSILIEIREDELKNEFRENLKKSIETMLQSMKKKCVFDLNKDFQQLVSFIPKGDIPEVFE